MKIVEVLRRMAFDADTVAVRSNEIVAGISNQSTVLNDRLKEILAGMANQSGLLNERLKQVVEGTANQSGLLNDLNERLKQVVEGTANQSSLLNDKLQKLIADTADQTRLLNDKLATLIEGTTSQSHLLDDKLTAMIDRQNVQLELQKIEIAALRELLGAGGGASDNFSTLQAPPVADSTGGRAVSGKSPLETALGGHPLMIASKTYNTSHPDYDANLVRNFPGRIFNADKPCSNSVYANLKQLADGEQVPDETWNAILKDALEEAKTVPHSDQVFERRTYIEKYLEEIARNYQAHYAAGWVNLDDALFLYWLVRKLKPKTIVQTGVCNGLSSAFMVLGLVKNGSEGKLHAVDMPPIFDSQDAGWKIKGKVYGVVIPEGKSSGWIVPDAYRDRFAVWSGDAKALLPKLVDKVDAIDLFYHDSDHTYDHMMFEFREAKRKLKPGGLIVGDDVSWNASVWDFADEHAVPSYNYKGAVGVAFF
jgi:predicted O-methyltransferase YrrM